MDFTYLKKFMDDAVAEGRTPGNSVCVYQGGRHVFSYTVGYDNLEKKTPLQEDALFNIHSCSKVATVTAGMQLVEQGKILLTDPLSDYMPEYTHMTVRGYHGSLVPAENPIRVADLFTMSAGFNYDCHTPAHEEARRLTNGHMNTREVARCMAKLPLFFEPGTRWFYSLCHDVLAALVEEVSGLKFRDYMKKYIFDPLDMHDTGYHHTPETLARTAEQYRFVSDVERFEDAVSAQIYGSSNVGHFELADKGNGALGDEYDSGGGGVITSADDYGKLMNALSNGGVGATGERILSRQAIDLMRTNQLSGQRLEDLNWPQLRGCGYGLGVRTHIDPVASGCISSIGEFGWGGAAGATCVIDPSVKLGVFYVQHTLNPREEYYQPRIRNAVYTCL